jgi:prolyl oligopeptidase
VLIGAVSLAMAADQRPATRRKEVRETIHGVEIVDPYRWLEDQDSPETRAWIQAQNEYTQSKLGSLPIRPRIAQRLEKLLRVERLGAPLARNGRYFFSRQRPDDEQAVLYWRKGVRGKDRLLVDPHPLSPDRTTSVSFMDVSRDGTLVAYGIRRGGEDEVEVRIRETDTGRELPDYLPRSHVEAFSFTRDKTGFYYTLLEPLKGRRVYYHRMGSPASEDRKVFGDGYGAETMVGHMLSENGRWLVLIVYRGWSQNDLFVKDLKTDGPVRPLVVGFEATFSPDFAGDRMFVLTDYKAPRRRVLEADLSAPSGPAGQNPDTWREVIPQGPTAIEEFSMAAGRLFVNRLENVATRLDWYDLDGTHGGTVKLPGMGSASTPAGPWEGTEAFYSYESHIVPPTTFRLDTRTERTSVWSRMKVPIRSSDFTVSQIRYRSRDGVEIPMFIIYRKGLKCDGLRPTHLTGYGGFAVSMTPYFDAEAILWAESGGVVAIPALRGGGEFGEAWHRAGMLDKKQNVFDDFHAAAEWLIANKYTSPERLVISGGSNGGLLVGAALTQRPELFGAVVCEVPLLDMIRYHLFLQGPQWVPEYGSAEDPEQFKTLYAYSPYHHVDASKQYPAVLFATGDADTRVAPLHARKMTALLQSLPEQRKPILLLYETTVGHSGGEPISKYVERRSLVLGFMYDQVGLTP